MKNERDKIILIDVATILLGTFLFIGGALESGGVSNGAAALGGTLVVLGVMIRKWRKEFKEELQEKKE